MINIQDITFSYTKHGDDIFNHLSLSIHPGKTYGLLGPNGSGKTTLLYITMGLLKSQQGQVEVEGTDVCKRSSDTLQELYLIPEEFELPSMTLSEYTKTYSPFYPNFSNEVLQQCLDIFQLPSDIHIDRLSMGQKKKLLMAFALACGTKYLLMDEPTNGLDIPSKKQFRKAIATNMTNERTILISTHQVHDVEQLLDHVLILGSPSQDASSNTPSTVLFDVALPHLSSTLSFTYEQSPNPSPNSLYTERTPLGFATISPRLPDEEETPLNLELLYNAVQNGKIPTNITTK